MKRLRPLVLALALILVATALLARRGDVPRPVEVHSALPSPSRSERVLIPATTTPTTEPPPTTEAPPPSLIDPPAPPSPPTPPPATTSPPAETPAPAPSTGTLVVDWALWERIHQCEQADSWYAYGRFGNGLQGGGGLGMSDGAWSMAVRAARKWGIELPGFVLDATPEQQMTAAQAFLETYGWAWQCT